MLAGLGNFVMEQGCVFEEDLLWLDCSGIPVDLSSATAILVMRDGTEDGEEVLLFSDSPGASDGTITMDSQGHIKLFADASLTGGIAATVLNCYYALTISPAGGTFPDADDAVRLLEGFVTFKKSLLTITGGG